MKYIGISNMPRKCCVYGCKSIYKSTEVRYSVFTFPRDETLRREWIRKISNANFNPTKYTCVREKHFTVEEVSRFHVIGDKQVSTVLYIYFLCVYYITISLLSFLRTHLVQINTHMRRTKRFKTHTWKEQKDLKHTHEKTEKI